MGKLITSLLYHVYNIRHYDQIEKLFECVKKANTTKGEFFAPETPEEYIQSWGKSGGFYDQKIMNKKDLLNFVKEIPDKKIYSWAYTGGSYGEPLRVPYSRHRNFVRTATFKYFNEIGGYELGDAFALIRAKDKSKIIKYLRNEFILIPTDVSRNKLLAVIKELINKEIKIIIGYPTVMFELAQIISEKKDLKKKLQISSLISVSEMLDWEKRNFIYDTFGCSFIDRYANEEVGLIAQQREFAGDYFVNKYGVYVEVVDIKTNKPSATGEIGKVLVTDVTNKLIPVIRYDTGDLAVAGEYSNNQLTSIKRVIGREVEKLLNTQGNPVSSLSLGPQIYKPLSKDQVLVQFQLVQVAKTKYMFKIKGQKGCIKVSTLNNIKCNLKEILGYNADITVRYVSDIPPQSSGKRPVYKYDVK